MTNLAAQQQVRLNLLEACPQRYSDRPLFSRTEYKYATGRIGQSRRRDVGYVSETATWLI